MVSVEELAYFPSPYYTCYQASSYDRRSISPTAPLWFANNDGYYNGGNFIRIDTVEGRIEKVMLDHTGPGVITRFWMTSLDKEGVLRFYFDGSSKPQWIIANYDVMKIGVPLGRGLLQPHTSYRADGGGGSTLYLPIPYAKGCKITFEVPEKFSKQPRYYQINYRKYGKKTKVETFSKEVVLRAQKKIDETNNLLLQPEVSFPGKTIIKSKEKLKAQDSILLNLPEGGNAVYEIKFSITLSKMTEFAQVMRELVFTAEFDGKQTVWVPISDFSGGGVGAPYVNSWFLSSDGKGNIISRWLMPYKKNAIIGLRNYSSSDV